jgi:hypothetical protein
LLRLLLILNFLLLAQSLRGECTCYSRPDSQLGPAIFFGKEFKVPELKLKFEDRNTGSAVKPIYVRLFYTWQAITYPYPEHSWGAWYSYYEIWDCKPEPDGTVVVPALEIKPRGWYDGKYSRFPWPRKPHFEQIEVRPFFDGYNRTTFFSENNLSRLAKGVTLIKTSSSGLLEVFPEGSSKAIKTR